MKTTDCDRNTLALLAAGELPAGEARAAREHVARCAKCRAVLAEYEAVVRECAEVSEDLARRAEGVDATRLRWRIAGAIRRETEKSPPVPIQRWAWLAAAAAVVVAGLLATTLWRSARARPGETARVPAPAPIAPAPAAGLNPSECRLGTYRMALNRSWDELDARLAAGARSRVETPVGTGTWTAGRRVESL